MYITDVFKDERGKIDIHLFLFFLNVFCVVLGYSLRGSAFQLLKISRIILVVISLLGLFYNPGTYRYIFPGKQTWKLWVFTLLNFYVLVFSFDFIKSLLRIISWLPFLIYINYFIVNAFRKFSSEVVKQKLLQIFNLCYIYPMLIVSLVSNPLQNKDIYGTDISGFKSNVIGWAGTLVFITTIDLLVNLKISVLVRRVLIGITAVSLIIIASSGSRSSYISIAVTLLILVFQNKHLNISYKFIISFLITVFSFYVLADKNSAINKRIQKSELQLKTGEAREELLQTAIQIMKENPLLFLTGFGYEMSVEGINAYKDIDNDLRLHNSYLEILVSTGGFTFIFFILFYLLNAVFKYVRYDISKYVFLPTLIFIPAFESNLNAGQFLFFPWMTFLFFYIHYRSYHVPIPATPDNSLPISETNTNETNHSIFQNRRNYT